MSEYWIEEDGSVQFSDGDVGDYNHEGIVISILQTNIIEKVYRVCDPKNKYKRRFDSDSDWDEWQAAVVKSWADKLISRNIKQKEKIEKLLENNPDVLLMNALKEAGVKKIDWQTANEIGDARDYAMQNWGWKTYRDGNVDTWRLTKKDMQAIIDGLDEISNSEGWSEREFQKYEFSINVFSTGKHFYLKIPQMEKWLINPTASITQDSTEEKLMNQAAKQGSRQQDLDLIHPVYKNRPGVNPFGDSNNNYNKNYKNILENNFIKYLEKLPKI